MTLKFILAVNDAWDPHATFLQKTGTRPWWILTWRSSMLVAACLLATDVEELNASVGPSLFSPSFSPAGRLPINGEIHHRWFISTRFL